MAQGKWYKAKVDINGRMVEFYATASDMFMRESFFCTYLDFNEKKGQEVREIRANRLEIERDMMATLLVAKYA